MSEHDPIGRPPGMLRVTRRAVLGGLAAAAAAPWLLPEPSARADDGDQGDSGKGGGRHAIATTFVPRQGHVAVPLDGGRTLVAGGLNADGFPLADVVVFTAAGAVYALAPLNLARYAHAAVALPGGQVLVLGGLGPGGPGAGPLADAELYDPDRNVWTAATPMQLPRYSHTAVRTAGDQVLIIGGYSASLVSDTEAYSL